MSAIRTSMIREPHAYTSAKVPWRLDEYQQASATTSRGKKFGWRLFHYLSGGGMQAFGRTIQQEDASARQTRFLVVAGVLLAAWALVIIL